MHERIGFWDIIQAILQRYIRDVFLSDRNALINHASLSVDQRPSSIEQFL